LRHEVQTRRRRELLPCTTRTRWMLGSQRRLERRWEWLTCLPTQGALPQMSHTNDTGGVLLGNGAQGYQPRPAAPDEAPYTPSPVAEDLLRAQDLKQVMRRYLARLREHREALNRLNVYPVPDGDTGSNMTLTVESVVAAADGAGNMADLAQALAQGSLMGAQGNSGIILSQILRGLAETFHDQSAVDAARLAAGLERASAAAYRAVGRPVEGTILTVLRCAAEAAADTPAVKGETLAALLARVYSRAEQALQQTPEMLPVLKEAGVVDAGGAGFLLLLVAMLEHVTGERVTLPKTIFKAAAQLSGADGHSGDYDERSISDLHYEVMFLLEAIEGAGDRLRDEWRHCGDSIVVVGGEGTWSCHIHTDDIGAAIEAAIAMGRPHRIKVTDLLAEAAAESFQRSLVPFVPLPEVVNAKVGLVAVANGPGIVELFRGYGAQGVVLGGQTMNPSVGDLLKAVEAVPARTVVILPNNKNIIPAAEELDALTKKTVYVVPTRSVPQGIGAMISYATSIAAEALVPAMEAAAAAVHSGEMTRAVRDATTPVGAIREGDWLGLVDGKVQVISSSGPGKFRRKMSWLLRRLVGAAREERRMRRMELSAFAGALVALLERLVGPEAESVLIVTGIDADASVTADAKAWLEKHRAGVPVEILGGGQPLYPYLVGVE
jgi:DAK2 domain fusion protein YloV